MADLGAIGTLQARQWYMALDVAMAQNITNNPIRMIGVGYKAQPYRESWGTISGTVRDDTNALCARTVAVVLRSTRELIGITTSDATTGAYSISSPYPGQEHNVIFLDDAAGTAYNDLVARTTP